MSPDPVTTIEDRDAMHAYGRQLASLLRAGDLVVLSGELGAGKTTLTQGIGDGLRVRGPITSPTFSLARLHPSLVGGPSLLHVDAYRLEAGSDLADLELTEALTESVVVVEWGEGKVDDVSPDRLVVRISRRVGGTWEPGEEADPRTVTLHGIGPRWSDLPPTGR